MKVLVTGGAGFIGSHLCEALAARGDSVVVLDDGSSGSWGHLAGVAPSALTTVRGSVLDAGEVRRAMDGCAQVYHLAAVVGVRRVFGHPVATIEINVQGTALVLAAAHQVGCRVLLASTSEVYGRGRPDRRPFTEDDDLVLGTSLRWGYAASKAVDEYLGRAYFRERGLPVVVARYFNVVGPRQNLAYGAVVPQFVGQALRGEPLTVYGDGSQVRSFTWIGDAVQATLTLMDRPEAAGEVFNVGSGEAVSILDLAHRVKSAAGSSSPVTHVPYAHVFGEGFEDIQYRVPDIGKLRRVTGYSPSLDLDGILRRFIEWYSSAARGRGS